MTHFEIILPDSISKRPTLSLSAKTGSVWRFVKSVGVLSLASVTEYNGEGSASRRISCHSMQAALISHDSAFSVVVEKLCSWGALKCNSTWEAVYNVASLPMGMIEDVSVQ